MKYLHINLQILELNLYRNYIGANSENMRYLAQGIKLLPKFLKTLKLLFSDNRFEEINDGMEWLSEGIK